MRAAPPQRFALTGFLAVVLIVAASLPGCAAASRFEGAPIHAIALDDWQLQSSALVRAGGRALSRPGYAATGWYPVSVPSTVLAGLVDNGAYRNLYYGTNLQDVPEGEFQVPWWYRTEFTLTPEDALAFSQLHFDGINYRAEVWVNGKRLATAKQVVGTFRRYAFDVTRLLQAGSNAVAVEVFPVDPNRDLTITWIDWSPMAPDHGMGLWQDVYLTTSGQVTLSDPQVTSQLALPGLDSADLTVSVTVSNASDRSVTTPVGGSIRVVQFSTVVDLGPGESKTVTFDPQTFPELHVGRPRVWWPYQMGPQELYTLHLTAGLNGEVSDRTSLRFGIRDLSTKLEHGNRVWLVNGRPILVRGGGWAPDMMLREQPARTLDQLRYVRDLGLNAIRLEGKMQPDWFYELTDRLGILVLPGWMCCDVWQRWGGWNAEDRRVAEESMYSQALELRNHPSVIAFLIGSDTNPPPDAEALYLRALQRANWPDPILASASGDATQALGPTGVKMTGPYEWIPPSYWYYPRAPGGAEGFNTETSAGASIPELENLRRMMTPAELHALWTDPSAPQYHAGVPRSQFNNFRVFDDAMTARLGAPRSLADYVEKAQLLNYESERAMFEAFSRNKYSATGIIQWMMQNAWPSLHWNLFDWFLSPNGSYFGAKKANEPLHIQYSYDDRSVVVVNQTLDASSVTATARVFNLDGRLEYKRTLPLRVAADDSRRAFMLPKTRGLSSTYFVELTLRDANGRVVSWNDYWLSTTPERLAWSRTTWYYTPTRRYADFRALSHLPSMRLRLSACTAGDGTAKVTLVNRSSKIAFFIRARLTRGADGQDLLPIRWSDDYVTLMPRERTTLAASYRPTDLGGKRPAVVVGGWNVPQQTVTHLAGCG